MSIFDIFKSEKADGLVLAQCYRRTLFGHVMYRDEWKEVKILQETNGMYKVRFVTCMFPDTWTEKDNLKPMLSKDNRRNK